MARKNLLLTVSLLVMVGALIGGILWTDPGAPATFGDLSIADAPAAEMADERVADLGPAERPADHVERAEVDDMSVPPAVIAGGIAVRGRLVDEDGVAQPGVDVRLAAGTRPSTERSATTNQDGEFLVEYAGDRAGGELALSPAASRLFSASSTRRMAFERTGDVTDLGDLVVIAASRIAGRVVDAADRPVAGVTVEMRESVSALGPTHVLETGDDGRFEFSIEPCSGRLSTRAKNFLPTDRSVTVERGLDRTDLVVRLAAGDSIAGRIVDDVGEPIAGARVAPFRSRKLDGNTLVDRLDPAEAATSDSNGMFELGGIEPGDSVRLRAWAEGHGAEVLPSVAAGRRDVMIRLVRAGSVSGVVVDAGGEPIAGSQVETVRDFEGMFGGTVVAATTDAAGRFELSGVPAGELRLRATGSHRPVTSAVLTVPGGAPVEGVRLVVDAGAGLVVSVLDADNRPVERAIVRVVEDESGGDDGARRIERRVERDDHGERDVVFDSSDGELGRATTDAEGRAEIRGLPSGAAVVRATHADYAGSRPARVVFPRTGVVEARLTLREGGRVEVTVVGADGEPRAADFTLRGPILAGESATTSEHRSGADGLAVVGPLAAGSYEAILVQSAQPVRIGDMDAIVTIGESGTELAGTAVPFDVHPRQLARLQLVFPVLTRVTGVVRDAGGPVAGVTVRMGPDSDDAAFGRDRRATTDGDGRYAIHDLAAGDYSIRWGRPGATVDFVDRVEVPAGLARLERDLTIAGGTVRLVVEDALGGEPVEGATVTLERVSEDGSSTRRVRTARVVMITADASEGGQAMSMTTGGPGAVTTDARGVAEIVDVPPGAYRAVVRERAHETKMIPGIVVSAGQVVEMPPALLKAGGFLRGRVTGFAEDDRFPFATVAVEAVGHDAMPRSETAMNGAIRVDGLAPGRYRARATEAQAGEPGAWVEFDITAGERTLVRLPLP